MIGAMPSLALDRCSTKQQGSIGHLKRKNISLHFRPPQLSPQSTSDNSEPERDQSRLSRIFQHCANRRLLFQLSVLAPLCGALLLFVGLVQLIPGADGEAFSYPLIIIGSILFCLGLCLIAFRFFWNQHPTLSTQPEDDMPEIKPEEAVPT